MKERSFEELVRHLRHRQEMGEKAPVLLLGAGASKDAGIEDMQGLYTLVGANDFDEFVTYIEDRGEAERYSLLGEYLTTQRPEQITDGYRALANLCAEGYFDIVLTTNLDPLVDDALVEAELWRRDYALIINGLLRPERLGPMFTSNHPRVKVVKLHGDLYWRMMAWTPKEMDGYLTDIEPWLTKAMAGREVLVVGQSLRDEKVRDLALGTGSLVWFTTPGTAPDHLHDFDQVLTVVDARSRFEAIFPTLASELGVLSQQSIDGGPARPSETQTTFDDLLLSTVGVGSHGGSPTATGFLMANPRVIISDTSAVTPAESPGDSVPIRLSDGRTLDLPISSVGDHPFGPVAFEVPGDVQIPGLQLAAGTAAAGSAVTLAVAAGDTTGISRGTVVTGEPTSFMIHPLGDVSDVVELRVRTAPGSSGAPVVDQAKQVIGVVVAGSEDPDNPLTLMLPTSRWPDLGG